MIFELGDKVWNVALVGVRHKLSPLTAAEKLVELSESVADVFTARKLLRDLPKSIKVANSKLAQFKETFETEEYFHHQRVVSVGPPESGIMRDVWITLRDPDEDPDIYFGLASDLLNVAIGKHAPLMFGAQIVLKAGVVITYDREPR